MSFELNVGDSMAVLLVDGIEDTPFVGATLRMKATGVEVEVPYLPGFSAPQFAHVDEWFRKMTPPDNVLVYTREGPVTLYGCRWSGHADATGTRVGSGSFTAREALLRDRDRPLSDALLVQKCYSRVDGMNRWSRMTAVSSESDLDENSRTVGLNVSVKTPTSVEWQQGEATLRVRSTWRFSSTNKADSRVHELEDNVVLESEWDEPRPFIDHLAEQRMVLHLLTFLFGKSISFRKHHVQDESIAARLMNGDIFDHPFTEVISSRTMRERAQPAIPAKELERPLLVLDELGADGLTEWAKHYETWKRFILPAVTNLSQRRRFAEDIVMNMSMSIEAASHLLGKRPGEEETHRNGRPTTATHAYRCLEVLGIQWGDYIHSQVGLAKAIANNYNAVKHADRGGFPDAGQTILIGDVIELVVRLIAVRLTGQGDELIERYRQGSEIWSIAQRFNSYRLRIVDDRGTWEEYAPGADGQ